MKKRIGAYGACPIYMRRLMKLLLVSLGCDKNLVDSEEMLALLSERGYEITDDEKSAEAAVINTCCFIDAAKKESIEEILSLGKLKKSASLKVLVVTGCMAQRYKEEILKEMPEVDAIVGTTGISGIADAVDAAFEGKKTVLIKDASESRKAVLKRVVSTGGRHAFLKIAEGCDKNCTYCIIPKIRGHYRSRPMEELTDEARDLVNGGVRELILVAQETTIYGTDLYGRKSLHILLQKLCEIPGLKWVRILYCYPEEIYPELIRTIADEPKICHYLDLPIQHASDEVLKRMNRRTTREDLEILIGALREEIPDIILRTTLITGFPGETDDDHKELLSFVEKMKFDRLGVFTYSREEGTPASLMKPQVPKKTARKRRGELMLLQQKISLENGRKRIGSSTEAVIDQETSEDGIYTGRTYGEAPGIDGSVYIKTDKKLKSGDFIKVRITEATEYDLEGEA